MRSHQALDRLPRLALPGDVLIVAANTPRARLMGLTLMHEIPEGWALWLPRCRSVHTFGMRFALDLLWLDGEGNLVSVHFDIRPRRMRSCLRACSVVEARSGEGERLANVLAAQRATSSDPGGPLAGVPPADWPLSEVSSAGGCPS